MQTNRILAGLWATPISGASMNPVPDLVRCDMSTTWIYIGGPIEALPYGQTPARQRCGLIERVDLLLDQRKVMLAQAGSHR